MQRFGCSQRTALRVVSLRLKRPRRNEAAKRRQPKQLAHAINEIWSMDLVADALFDGRRLRMLTVGDLYMRDRQQFGEALDAEAHGMVGVVEVAEADGALLLGQGGQGERGGKARYSGARPRNRRPPSAGAQT